MYPYSQLCLQSADFNISLSELLLNLVNSIIHLCLQTLRGIIHHFRIHAHYLKVDKWKTLMFETEKKTEVQSGSTEAIRKSPID